MSILTDEAIGFLFGDLAKFQKDPLRYVEDKVIGHPSPVQMRFGHRHVVFCATPSSVRHVLVNHRDRYDKGREVLKLKPLMGDSVLTAMESSERWHASRAAAKPAFSPESVEHGFDLAMAVLSQEIASQSLHAGQVVELHDTMGRLALRMATAALFHTRMSEEQAADAFDACTIAHSRLTEATWRLVDHDSFLPTRKHRQFDDAIRRIENIIRQVGEGGGGLFDGLKALTTYGEHAVINEAVTLLVAGFETSGTLAGWLAYALACRPDIVAAIREEDARSGAGDWTVSSMRRRPYVRAVVSEVLRLYPSAWWYARTAQIDDEIDGTAVKAGTTVFICPWVLHRQPSLWPDPERLDPQRFIGNPVRDKYAYIPFGAGPRVCIGQHLAMAELQAMAIALATSFDMVPDGPDIQYLRPEGGITLGHPKEQLKVRMFVRNPQMRSVAA